jgi:light-regulated signal transduction histidine kinase (bacteriophytochrome)
METVDELDTGTAAETRSNEQFCIQAGCYLLELSLDWIVLRASENIHHLLRESHVAVIDEPLGKFVHAQALHDLRNLFSKLSGTVRIARAYAVRLTDDHDLVDIAFQLSEGRVLLEAVPSAGSFGECFGSVGGLIAGLAETDGQPLLEGGARRMRALTGYDRVTLTCGDRRVESSRGAFAATSKGTGLPMLIADSAVPGVSLFPGRQEVVSVGAALLRAPDQEQRESLKEQGIRSMLRVVFKADGLSGEFSCQSRAPRAPSFELHAAAELFAQMFAMRLAIAEATKL